jgi:hypothetical protein
MKNKEKRNDNPCDFVIKFKLHWSICYRRIDNHHPFGSIICIRLYGYNLSLEKQSTPAICAQIYFFTFDTSRKVMQKKSLLKILGVSVIPSLIILSSCSKQKELKEMGCVSGRTFYGRPYVNVGPMTKRDFYLYLDSPDYKFEDNIVRYDMRWKKIEKKTDCPT